MGLMAHTAWPTGSNRSKAGGWRAGGGGGHSEVGMARCARVGGAESTWRHVQVGGAARFPVLGF